MREQTILNFLKKGLVLAQLLLFNNAFGQTASFSVSTDSGCSPLTVTFTNTSTGATSYLWRFGNGNTSVNTNPGAIYTTPGNYTVTLVAINSSGKDSVVKSNLVTVFKKPAANFFAYPTSRCAPVTVLFNDSTVAGSGAEASWLWDFGDGNISTFQNPSHVYKSAGKYTVFLLVTDVNGCTDSIKKQNYIFLSQESTGSFTASDSSACAPPLVINFTSSVFTKIGGTLKYSWDFGDGSTSTLKDPSHTYTSLGSFTVALSATDSANCTGIFTKVNYININRDIASFTYNKSSGCPPLKVSFTNTTSPLAPGSKFLWNYGNGSTSIAKDSVSIYNTPGTYSVKLLVISPSGCTDSVIHSNIITVDSAPVVSFTALDTENCQAPVRVHFYDSTTTGGGLFWHWNFGDGSSSNGQNPSHLYTTFGNFNVSLTATGSNGCPTTLTKAAYVKISPPRAKIHPEPPNGCGPLKVQFYDSTQSIDPLVAWHWNFGTGDTSNVENPVYTYKDTGDYTVQLSVLTKGGCRDTISYCCIKVGIKPNASFTATPLTHCFSDSLPVAFTNLTNNYTVWADSFFWMFGYGATSYIESPVDPYHTRAGEYNVTLVAFHNGCPDSLVKPNYISVLPPYSIFTYSQPLCNPDSVFFTDMSDSATSIKWDFGDGDTSTALNPVHIYSDTGLYIVTHWAYNDTAGCKDSITKKIAVYQPPAGFHASDTAGCLPITAKFTPGNITAGNTYLWNFGNGDSSLKANPVEVYTEPGSYTVSLKIITVNGCLLQTIKKNYIIANGPYSNFAINPTTGCVPFTTSFVDSSTSVAPIVDRELLLGDGRKIKITSKTQNIVYDSVPLNQNTGYNVTYYVTDSNGCTASKTINIQPAQPKPSFTATLANDCKSQIFNFTTPPQDQMGISPLSFYWDLGNGNVSSLPNPSTIYYSIVGTYKVTLVLTDGDGCVDSATQDIRVLPKLPKADFSVSKTFANCPPLIDSFFDNSLVRNVGIAEWFWNFGDGTSSNLQNPVKVYNNIGKFTVSLKIIDSFGCTDSITYPNLVTIIGPTGNFTYTPATGGCSPLTVHFTAHSSDAALFEWDLGDGTIEIGTGDTLTYTYHHNTYSSLLPIGYFTPKLVLTDSTGKCTYTTPPKDSISVYPPPVPAESYSPTCFGYPTNFTDSSEALVGKIVKWDWAFGDTTANSGLQGPSHIYQHPGFYDLTFTITSNFGCINSISPKIKINGVKAAYAPLDSNACVGRPFHFYDKSVSDTPVISWLWVFGDGDSSGLQNPVHTYSATGIHSIKLFVTDARGCSDTIRNPPVLIVGDTAPPPPPTIYRVTVTNNDSVEIDFSKANLFNFYEYVIYRITSSGNVKAASSFNINDTILFDNGVNNLASSYCYKIQLLNFCGMASNLNSSTTNCTVFLSTQPDTNSVIVNWTSYVGWNSVKRYILYKKNAMDSFIPIASVSGNINSFIDSSAYCVAKYTYKIEAIEGGGDSQEVSWSDTAVGSPLSPVFILPNQVITVSDSNNKEIWIQWDKQPKIRAKGYLLYKSTNGTNYNQVGSLFGKDTLSAFDTMVDVNSQSYYYQVKLEDICGDVSGYSNPGKTILLNADTNLELLPYLSWSPYTGWPEGVNYYTIQLYGLNGNWDPIGYVMGNNPLNFTDNITDLNSMPSYCYRVIAHRNANPYGEVVSESNAGCVKVRTTIFAPNAFTPNGDGINDVFQIKGLYISNFDLKIYNRWGEFLFETQSLDHAWDGTYKGQKCESDVYIWILSLNGVDQTSHFISGNVTLLK